MKVICLETEAFYKLIDEVIDRLEPGLSERPPKWIGTDEAMALLQISSKTTLQQFRDEGEIRFTQPRKRIILYDRDSIEEFLERKAKERF